MSYSLLRGSYSASSSPFPKWYLLLLCLVFVLNTAAQHYIVPSGEKLDDDFDWNSLIPSTKLRYEPCYKSFECARLEVPLDWANLSNPNKVQLAVMRLPAIVAHTDASFGGTILINPGGPGGSGVDFLRQFGSFYQNVTDDHKHFELLSWDPRGVHLTTPSVACFTNDWQRKVWKYKNWAVGALDASELSFDQKWAATEGFGMLCEKSEHGVFPDGSNMRQYVTTALTVRDMVEIIDQVENHRQVQNGKHVSQVSMIADNVPLLNYWGLSYGTFVGNTFASMFPERVGRVILDGNVDGDDYKSTGWLHNLLTINGTLNFFFEYCFEAEADCALRKHSDTGPADMTSRVHKMLAKLKRNPIPVVYDQTTDFVTYLDVTALILGWMYMPHGQWIGLSQVLADLVQGNASSMTPHLRSLDDPHGSAQISQGSRISKSNDMARVHPKYTQLSETTQAIMCSDGDDITNLSKDDWQARLKRYSAESPLVGAIWAGHPFFCTHWPLSLRSSADNRFVGPFGSRLVDYDRRASPLLLIGNTADPVTPLRNAFMTSSLHEGSVVLTQNTPGHCSGNLNPSACTFKHVKRFFNEGLLPANGTVCEGDTTPWGRVIGPKER